MVTNSNENKNINFGFKYLIPYLMLTTDKLSMFVILTFIFVIYMYDNFRSVTDLSVF